MDYEIKNKSGIYRQTHLRNPAAYKLKLFILFMLWIGTFYPVYPDLIKTWLNSSDNSHCILVPLIALYFIWQKRDSLTMEDVNGDKRGTVILIFSLALYVLSFAGGVAFIARSMIVFSLIGLVLLTMGSKIFKEISFPLFFLLFMVPVPDSILNYVAFPLQLFATDVSAILIRALSIPVHQEGNMLYFAQAQLEVAESCSGIRSIMALTMLSFVFIYISDCGWRLGIIFIASAIPIALAANIIRVSSTGILAHFWGDKVARGFLHQFSGLAIFAFGFLLLLGEYKLLARFIKRRRSSSIDEPSELNQSRHVK